MDHHDHVNLLQPAELFPGDSWADLGAGSGAFTLALRELEEFRLNQGGPSSKAKYELVTDREQYREGTVKRTPDGE